MAIRKLNPITPGTRHMSVSTYEEITKTTPEKSLVCVDKDETNSYDFCSRTGHTPQAAY